MKEQTIIERMNEAIDFYTRHSKWERKRAEQATDGSKIQNELMMASEFNRGRASAYKEMLSMLGVKEDV